MALGSISLKLSMWLRYVDDTFILWPHQEDDQTLLDHVNSMQPSIQFTMEKGGDNKLPFLDVLLTRTEQNFRSSVYRKPTFTGEYLNINSHNPYNVKKRIVYCLQHWAKAISSDIDAYQDVMISLRCCIAMTNYTYTYTYTCRCIQKIFNTIKTSGHSSLEKYTSHLIWKVSKGLRRVLLCET